MAEGSAIGSAPPRFGRLAEILEQEGSERSLVHECLELVRGETRARAVSAYVPGRGGYELVGSVGRIEDPLHRSEVPSRKGVWRIGGGFVVVHEAADEAISEELRLMLAAGLRLCRYRSRLQQRDFDAKYRGVELEVIYDVGTAVASTLDLEELAEEILLRAVSLLDARRGALYLRDEDSFELHRTIGGTAEQRVAVEDADEEHEYPLLLPGAEHALAVPIETDGVVKGLLVVGDKESRVGVGPFVDADRRSLAHFATQAAIALEQARLHREALEKERLEREMELASQIQRGILPPTLPVVEGFELLAWTRPALHVGGDYYDLIELSDDRLALVVADVSGKGVPAALLVSTVHAALRLLLAHDIEGPELCRQLNDHLLRFSASNKFVTLFLAELDPTTQTLRYVNAGHNPALLRVGSTNHWLEATGVPLGLLPDATFEQCELELFSGDLLCVYSDGVTEASSPEGEELGESGLISLFDDGPASLASLRDALDERLQELTDGLPQGDDQTVVMLRRLPAEPTQRAHAT